jgi:hypothetical protein
MSQAAGEQVQVQIKADEKELVGQFSNLVMFHHTAEEFTVHFIYVFPNVPQGKLVSSVIVSPGHAKRILRALEENIRRYEKQFGPIREVTVAWIRSTRKPQNSTRAPGATAQSPLKIPPFRAAG